MNKFTEAEKANQEAANIANELVLSEARAIQEHYKTLASHSDSSAQNQINSLDAISNANNLLLSLQKLHTHGLLQTEQDTLKQAIDTFQRLHLRSNTRNV